MSFKFSLLPCSLTFAKDTQLNYGQMSLSPTIYPVDKSHRTSQEGPFAKYNFYYLIRLTVRRYITTRHLTIGRRIQLFLLQRFRYQFLQVEHYVSTTPQLLAKVKKCYTLCVRASALFLDEVVAWKNHVTRSGRKSQRSVVHLQTFDFYVRRSERQDTFGFHIDQTHSLIKEFSAIPYPDGVDTDLFDSHDRTTDTLTEFTADRLSYGEGGW